MKAILLAVVFAIFATSCQSVVGPVKLIPVASTQVTGIDADVVVVGSSLAGWAAAIAASREGADTILITETSCIGGQASCAGVSTWDAVGTGTGVGLDHYFRATLEGEYRDANVRLGGCYSSVAGTSPGTFVEGDNFCPHPDRVRDELLSWLNAFDVRLVGPVDVFNIGVDGTVQTSEGSISGNIVIEATETGELIPTSLRHPVDPLCKQRSTWVAGIREPGSGGARIGDISYPTRSPAYSALLNDGWVSGNYHWAGLSGQEGLPVYRRTHDLNGDLVIYLNWMNDDADPVMSKDKTMQQLVFLASHGYADWTWGMRPIPYVRTSNYRLNGQTTLGAAPRGVDSWPDSVAVASYRTDYHGDACGTLNEAEPYGQYDIPIGIGIPSVTVPILVAMPRSADITDMRSTSFRMQPDEMNFGEAMGTLAAIASREGVLPQDVPVSEVRAVLISREAKVDVS